MYKTIYVPVDNSDYSNQAIDTAVTLGKKFESKLVGSHVYAAQMHDYRFKQMEYTLPDEYLEETELDRQRKIHDSLITMGLELISDSYLDHMKKQCEAAGLEFEPKMMDGKHHVEIIKDIQESQYDLTVLGVMGIGRVRDSQIGSVCERVTRTVDKDVLVIKQLPEADDEPVRDTILVGIDGSPQSFGALMTAIELAEKFDKKVEAISVYDPYLHYSVFNGVVNVLTEKAAKVFRFEEQNQLHEEIIDTGLAQIYQSHLEVANTIAEERGVEIKRTLLDGKCFQKVLDHARKPNPWMLVIGRIGVHSDKSEPGLGSNAENLLRSCPCDILLTTRLHYPELDLKAEETIRWTPEAEERMKRVPQMVQGIARTAIYRLAVEQGHSVITSDVLDEAMERYMPKSASAQTERLAEMLAIEKARQQATSICKTCGVTASEPDPVKCGVCNGTTFEIITPEMLDRIAAMEGGVSEETTYDGRKLKWTQDAKRALWTMKDAYQRRRAKARVEKSARIKKLPTVTLEFAANIIEEETGVKLVLPSVDTVDQLESQETTTDESLKLIGRDDKKNPLFSAFDWTPDAAQRVLQVPHGFMRDRTQNRVEELATERGVGIIDLPLVEDGIEAGKVMMEEMIKAQDAAAAEANGNGVQAKTANGNGEKAASKCPFSSAVEHSNGNVDLYLNEVGLMTELEARKKKN
ncbi:MAG: universal stress protein [Acidobacteria bacterium]|nr:universal stress protein [Acidobacteriota bacterium]NIM61524.1 universal stress protein [Acidobacteriota bacterium]NIO60535.1 universal stress protein [Acidobacteriota bacterium]NIQ31642.1 universal stress protein [Acidobacteriota bacterium]NIQ86881.1 universal stress protein [Acidobacteriota bacterium]